MQREICRVKISYAGSSEDHPGAALIKPGRHRYRPNEEVQRHNEGGTAVTDLSSLDSFITVQGYFYAEKQEEFK